MVVGASMAGLCAARVLADRFERVSVVDRDTFPTDPGQSRGQVPQGRHPHLLHVAGARLLDSWFPGIVDDLYDGGAVELDLCADFYWHQEGGVARRPSTDLKGPAASRPFLEATVRRHLTQLPNVEVRDRCAVAGAESRWSDAPRASSHRGSRCEPCERRAGDKPGWQAQVQLLMRTSRGYGSPPPVSTSCFRLIRNVAHFVLQCDMNSTGSRQPSCLNSTIV